MIDVCDETEMRCNHEDVWCAACRVLQGIRGNWEFGQYSKSSNGYFTHTWHEITFNDKDNEDRYFNMQWDEGNFNNCEIVVTTN